MKDLLKMDLQMFAEPDVTEGETEETVDTPEDEPTVKVAEMKRRLEKEQEKFKQEIEDIKNKQAEAVKEAYERAQAEAKMSADELQEYKKKEADRKYQEEKEAYEKQIAELTKEKKQREIRDESINKLNELNLSVNDESLTLVSADSLEGMAEKAEKLAKFLNNEKNKLATSGAPTIGGGSKSKTQNKNPLDEAKITGF